MIWTRIIESLAEYRPLWVAHDRRSRPKSIVHGAFLADALQQGRLGLAALFQNIDAESDEKKAWKLGSFPLCAEWGYGAVANRSGARHPATIWRRQCGWF